MLQQYGVMFAQRIFKQLLIVSLFFSPLFLLAYYFWLNHKVYFNLIKDLSEAIDVYNEWIDACEAANH